MFYGESGNIFFYWVALKGVGSVVMIFRGRQVVGVNIENCFESESDMNHISTRGFSLWSLKNTKKYVKPAQNSN